MKQKITKEFLDECDSLAKEFEEKNPLDALGDADRIRTLIEFAREHAAVKEPPPKEGER